MAIHLYRIDVPISVVVVLCTEAWNCSPCITWNSPAALATLSLLSSPFVLLFN